MYKNIRARDLKGMIGRINIIDVRKKYLFDLGNIPSSKNIPKNYLLAKPELYLKKDEEYYIYCTQGFESVKVCEELSKKGYKVINALGGYHDYIMN